MRILVAEDERGMSSALVAVLEHNGYDVDTAFDGEEAVEKPVPAPMIVWFSIL